MFLCKTICYDSYKLFYREWRLYLDLPWQIMIWFMSQNYSWISLCLVLGISPSNIITGAYITSLSLNVSADNNVPLPWQWGWMLCCHGYGGGRYRSCWDKWGSRHKVGVLATRRGHRQLCQRSRKNNDGVTRGSSRIYSVIPFTLPGTQDCRTCL